MRVAEVLVLVNRGRTQIVAEEIFRRIKSVIETTWRINSVANLVARVYYSDTTELNEIVEAIKSIQHVDRVEFSELVKVIDRRDDLEIQKDVRKIVDREAERRDYLVGNA